MTHSFRPVAIAAAVSLCLAMRATAQGAAPVEPVARLAVDVGGFYDALDNGYSDWRGSDVRVTYTGAGVSPFAFASTQQRREGHQSSYGMGSYVTLNRSMYSIVDFSVATGGTAVFYPRLRWDVSLLSDTHVVPGLVLNTGFTHVSFGGGSTGTILSAGPIYYHGPLIARATAHLNHDGAGGATTGSGDAELQYGREGHYWVGGGISGGREAYQVLSATPFDVQFTNVGASMFYQRWLTKRTAVLTRLDYQDKFTAYHRRGISVTYRVAF